MTTMFRGIQNIGNSCYLNSALQCLLHLPFTQLLEPSTVLDADQAIFKEAFSAWAVAKHEKEAHKEFRNVLLRLSLRYQLGNQRCQPGEVLRYLCCYQQDFQDQRPCDAQEALLYLLDFLHQADHQVWDRESEEAFFREFSKAARDEWKQYAPTFSPVSVNLTIQIEEVIICKSCQSVRSRRYPIFTMLDIDEGDVSLLNSGIKKEILEGYECDNCKKRECVKVTCWSHFPPYLIFYNKRKTFFLKEKIMLPDVKRKTHEHYELIMSINHRDAHFNCFIRFDARPATAEKRRSEGERYWWYLCDDMTVSKVSTVAFETIYLYVYRKKNNG